MDQFVLVCRKVVSSTSDVTPILLELAYGKESGKVDFLVLHFDNGDPIVTVPNRLIRYLRDPSRLSIKYINAFRLKKKNEQ